MFVGNERKVTVRKSELLSKLNLGLAEHESAYETATTGYKQAVVDFLSEALERAKAGDVSDIVLNLAVPQSYARDFKRAIAMIEMMIDDEVVLDENTFKQWVLGEWSWAGNFELSASAVSGYLGKALRK